MRLYLLVVAVMLITMLLLEFYDYLSTETDPTMLHMLSLSGTATQIVNPAATSRIFKFKSTIYVLSILNSLTYFEVFVHSYISGKPERVGYRKFGGNCSVFSIAEMAAVLVA
jgi:hypothetical protein